MDDESNLEINFKHAFSKITVEIDASDTGYGISAVSSEFNTSYLVNSLKLSTMTVTQSGSTSSGDVSFTNLDQQIITSNPLIISAQVGATNSYRIASLTINAIVGSNINLFENMTIEPGVSYTLKVRVTPDDAILDNNRVRINGQVWMRFNLGASGITAGTSPDLDPGNGSLWGHYYRWGDDLPAIETVYNGTTTSTHVPGIYGYYFENNNYLFVSPNFANAQDGWAPKNALGEPERGTNDPCPPGFRIPTAADFEKLLSSITPSWGAVQIDAVNVHLPVEILTSKRNRAVKLTIPMQGYGDRLIFRNIAIISGGGFFSYLLTRDYPTDADRVAITGLFMHSNFHHSKIEVFVENYNILRPYAIRCIGL